MSSLSRRWFVTACSSISLCTFEECFAADASKSASLHYIPPQLKGASSAAEKWIDEAILTKSLVGTLQVSRFVEPIYYLIKPTEWQPNDEHAKRFPIVRVPTGFVTDFASIPPLLYSIFRPDGTYAHAAVIHDYLYWSQQLLRPDADEIFRLAMVDLEVDPPTVAAIYAAVVAFGQRAWDKNAWAKSRGESRLLREFPTDPKTRWADWSKVRSVFY